jgi:hypothetical protein
MEPLSGIDSSRHQVFLGTRGSDIKEVLKLYPLGSNGTVARKTLIKELTILKSLVLSLTNF